MESKLSSIFCVCAALALSSCGKNTAKEADDYASSSYGQQQNIDTPEPAISTPPSCEDQYTIHLVKSIFRNSLNDKWSDSETYWRTSKVDIKLLNIRTLGFRESSQEFICEADAIAQIEAIDGDKIMSKNNGISIVSKAASENIKNYTMLDINKSKVNMAYGNSMAGVFYEASVLSSIGPYGADNIPKIGDVKFDGNGFSNRISYSSTFASSESGEKSHYVNAVGLEEMASAYLVFVSTNIAMIRMEEKKAKEQKYAKKMEMQRNDDANPSDEGAGESGI